MYCQSVWVYNWNVNSKLGKEYFKDLKEKPVCFGKKQILCNYKPVILFLAEHQARSDRECIQNIMRMLLVNVIFSY